MNEHNETKETTKNKGREKVREKEGKKTTTEEEEE